MKKLSRKILPVMLVLCMVMSLLSGMTLTAGAAAGTAATEVWYCGQKLDSSTPYLLVSSNANAAPTVLASATNSAEGYILYAEFANGTLTYKHGYDLPMQWNTQVNTAAIDYTRTVYGIKANGDLTIEMGEYNNQIWTTWTAPTTGALRSIDVDGNLTINGTGTLRVCAQPANVQSGGYMSYGIYASGDIRLNGGTIHMIMSVNTDGTRYFKDNKATYIAAQNIYVDGAAVKMRARHHDSIGAVTKYTGNLHLAEGYTVSEDKKINIGSDAFGTEAVVTDDSWNNNNNLSWTPPEVTEGGEETPGEVYDPSTATAATEVYYCGVKLDAATPYLMATAATNKDPQLSASATSTVDGYVLLAEFKDGTLTYKHGYSINPEIGTLQWNCNTTMAQLEAGGVYYGIKANGHLTIDVGSYNNSLYMGWTGPTDNGIHAIDVFGDLKIIGDGGLLKMCAQPAYAANGGFRSYGIYASGNVSIEGADVYIFSHIYSENSAATYNANKTTYVHANGGTITVDNGGYLKLRGKSYGYTSVTKYYGTLVTGEKYTVSEDKNIDVGSMGAESVVTASGWYSPNNLTVTPPSVSDLLPNATEVYFCGQTLNAENPYLLVDTTAYTGARKIKASSVDAEEGYALLAEFEEGKLTFRYGYGSALSWDTQIEMAQPEADGAYYGIKANGHLTIDVGSYDNFLYRDWNTDKAIRAIDVAGNLVIKGMGGSLKLSAQPAKNDLGGFQSYGIYALGNISIDGAGVYTYAQVYSSYAASYNVNKTTFVYAGEGAITVDGGGYLKMRGGNSGTYSSITRYEGKITAGEGYTVSEDKKINLDSLGVESVVAADWWNTNNNYSVMPQGGYFIEVGRGAKMGGTNKYLHAVIDEANHDNDVFYANDVAEGAAAEYDTATNTLKFLADAVITNYNNTPCVIKSSGNLTINFNGKNAELIAYPFSGSAKGIDVSGTLTLTGGGSAVIKVSGEKVSADGTAVIKSGGKVTFDDIRAEVYLADEKSGANDKRGVVISAPQIEFTDKADVKVATGVSDTANGLYPGRLFPDLETEEDLIVPSYADCLVGTLNASFTDGMPEEKGMSLYYSDMESYDALPDMTYMSVVSVSDQVEMAYAYAEGDTLTCLPISSLDEITVIAAGYDAAGKLIGTDIYTGAALGEEDIILTVAGASAIKMYIWESIGTLKPLRKGIAF